MPSEDRREFRLKYEPQVSLALLQRIYVLKGFHVEGLMMALVVLVGGGLTYVSAPSPRQHRSLNDVSAGPLPRVVLILLFLFCVMFGVVGCIQLLGLVATTGPRWYSWGPVVGFTGGFVLRRVLDRVRTPDGETTSRDSGSLVPPSRGVILGRVISLCLAVEASVVALYGGALLHDGFARAAEELVGRLYDSSTAFAVGAFLLGVTWGQVVTGSLVKATGDGVAAWGVSRGWQFMAASIHVVAGFSTTIPGLAKLLWSIEPAPALLVSLTMRGIVLWVGWRLTDIPPAGTIETLMVFFTRR